MTELWYPGGGGDFTSEPDYTTVPIYDAVYPTLGPLKRPRWATIRDAALADWSRSGLRFAVEVREYTWDYDDGLNHDVEILGQFDRRSIILRRQDGMPRLGQGSYTADYTLPDGTVAASPHVGVASFDMARLAKDTYLKNNRTEVRAIIAHEVGHCLGFGHGGTGVMAHGYGSSATTCSDEELSVARDWYGVI